VNDPHSRRLERHSSTSRMKNGTHTPSQSRGGGPTSEPRTVGEYALHHLFTVFIAITDARMNQYISLTGNVELRTEAICGPGVDPDLDQVIGALGHIARSDPKPLVDTLMLWRQGKKQQADIERDKLAHLQQNPASGSVATLQHQRALEHQYRLKLQADKYSTLAIYLLCRVLIEIFNRSTIQSLTQDLTGRLEDIIFRQLLFEDIDELYEHPIKQSNYISFGQVLGAISEVDFSGVTQYYLRSFPGRKANITPKEEDRAVLVIQSMRWIVCAYQPESAWDQTCAFLTQLANATNNASGMVVKSAFVSLIGDLLLPIAAKVTSQLNTPKWASVIDSIKPKLLLMFTKPKYWHSVFPALVSSLCVSPDEVFASQWLTLVIPLQPRLKERISRPTSLAGISRLLWVYLFRISDPAPAVLKNLSDLVKLIFIPGKKSYISTDPDVAEPLIEIIRIIGYKHREFCFKSIIFPLMNAEIFSTNREARLTDIEPEKIVIAIRAFLAIMSDVEKGESPPFPITFESQPIPEPSRFTPVPPKARPTVEYVSKTTLTREERLSRPVVLSGFDTVTMEAYMKFCKILGDITIFCDNTFGGQAVLDEKYFQQTPKTPISEAFSFRRDDHQNAHDLREAYYDLLHVAVQALPRCLSPSSKSLVNKSLVNLLCTATAHVKPTIASSAEQSLKSIAKQGHAQQVTVGFANYIFNFDGRYSTMTDGGLLGPGHIERTLKLYVELLQVWIEEIRQYNKRLLAEGPAELASGFRGAQLDRSAQLAYVDEVESHGLFFLCSPSRTVRSFAVTVLRLVLEFDTARGQDTVRIIKILEESPEDVIDVMDEKLTVAEKSRLQKALKKTGTQSPVIELCNSEAIYDTTLWFKLFPNVIRLSSERCPQATTLTREIVCGRISQMLKTIHAMSDMASPSSQNPMNLDIITVTGDAKFANTSPEILVDQWRLYLVFACTTLTKSGLSIPSPPPAHARKGSKLLPVPERIHSAFELFARIIPMVATPNTAVRDAIVIGLGSINKNLYRTLLEALGPAVLKCNEEAKIKLGSHQRAMSSPRRSHLTTLLRTGLAQIFKLTSHFLQLPEVYQSDWVLNTLVSYTTELRLFLCDTEVQNEWKYHKLRTHYCGLMEELYEGIRRTENPAKWMSFQSRKASFTLMEDWCGYSPNQTQIRQREDNMRSMLEREQEISGKNPITAAMEIEKRDLRTAALSTMATLCAGPISVTNDVKAQHLSFDVWRMLTWIDCIFATPSDKTHIIGRRALKNLIVNNQEHRLFVDRCLEMCYLANSPKALESYFEVVSDVLKEPGSSTATFWKVLAACLFIVGNENNQLRMKAARLLRTLEEREYKISRLKALDISISDKTIAVYKRAQFELSQKLAQAHPDLAFHVISESTKFFKELNRDQQRSLVATLLPWIQTIELKIDPNGGPTASSYMVLVNLFEITVKFGNALHNEIQALWQALATGPHERNVQIVLDFIIQVCLERKEQSFIDYARQIVVYLASSAEGSKVVEFLLSQITPKTMIFEKERRQSVFLVIEDAHDLPYVADMTSIFPEAPGTGRQQQVSLGQLSLMLLVDLIVAPTELAKEYVPLLLHVVMILWDHYIPRVQDQAREMLVHLIHELVISKDQTATPSNGPPEELIEQIRSHDSKVVWAYQNTRGRADDNIIRVPESMAYVTSQVVDIFSTVYPDIKETWGVLALKWASNCHVIHLACRSFQVFRSIMSTLEQPMLASMLARLSNTIADEGMEIQTFAMEILTTLRTIISAGDSTDLLQYPQLFWAICACLDSIHEKEYLESLKMLETLLEKWDLSDPIVIQRLQDSRPPKWQGQFNGLIPLLYKGVRSATTAERTIVVMEKLVTLPPNELIGDDTSLLFTILANLPRYLRSMEHPLADLAVYNSAENLSKVAEMQGLPKLAAALHGFAGRLYRSDEAFFDAIYQAIKPTFFPQMEFQSTVFLMSLLTNKLPWFKIKVMLILCMLIPQVDLRKPEFTSHGPDLIATVLRLLSTEFCPQALAVLDKVMAVHAHPLDFKLVRMSMIAANTHPDIRKQYEKVQSLYGLPEDSGWSIPLPAVHMTSTRSNVHAVFYTCANSEDDATKTEPTPEIDLVDEDYNDNFASDYRTATMMSDDTRAETHYDLVTKLESLDDFFNDDDDDMTDATPTSPHPNSDHQFSMSPDVTSNLYEQQAFPLLHQSLTRNISVSTFQNGLTDLRLSPSREPLTMNPTAFFPSGSSVNSSTTSLHLHNPAHHISHTSNHHTPTSSYHHISRPSLHARSVTSPAGTHPLAPLPPLPPLQNSPPRDDNPIGLAVSDDPLDDDDLPLAFASPTRTSSDLARRAGLVSPVMGNAFGPGGSLHLSSSSISLSHLNTSPPQTSPQAAPQGGPVRERERERGLRGFRSQFRRLTTGNGDTRAREAVRAQAASGKEEPRVPRIPDVHLHVSGRSNEL
jgi:hypothetical protein